MVMSKDALAERMERLGIRDSDFEETFARRSRFPETLQGKVALNPARFSLCCNPRVLRAGSLNFSR